MNTSKDMSVGTLTRFVSMYYGGRLYLMHSTYIVQPRSSTKYSVAENRNDGIQGKQHDEFINLWFSYLQIWNVHGLLWSMSVTNKSCTKLLGQKNDVTYAAILCVVPDVCECDVWECVVKVYKHGAL